MISNEHSAQAGKEASLRNSPDSSEGEDIYDDSLYGSDFHPPT